MAAYMLQAGLTPQDRHYRQWRSTSLPSIAGPLCALWAPLGVFGRFDGGRKCVRRDDAASSAVATVAEDASFAAARGTSCPRVVKGGVG